MNASSSSCNNININDDNINNINNINTKSKSITQLSPTTPNKPSPPRLVSHTADSLTVDLMSLPKTQPYTTCAPPTSAPLAHIPPMRDVWLDDDDDDDDSGSEAGSLFLPSPLSFGRRRHRKQASSDGTRGGGFHRRLGSSNNVLPLLSSPDARPGTDPSSAHGSTDPGSGRSTKGWKSFRFSWASSHSPTLPPDPFRKRMSAPPLDMTMSRLTLAAIKTPPPPPPPLGSTTPTPVTRSSSPNGKRLSTKSPNKLLGFLNSKSPKPSFPAASVAPRSRTISAPKNLLPALELKGGFDETWV